MAARRAAGASAADDAPQPSEHRLRRKGIMNESSQLRAPREWVELTTITDPNTPVVVRVQTTASGRPLYSMEIGMLRDGRMLRHIPVYTNQDGSVVPTDVAT